MLPKTEINHFKNLASFIFLSSCTISISYAHELDCTHSTTLKNHKVCSTQFKESRNKLNTNALTTYLITDAPQKLLQDTNQIWNHRLLQCKSLKCYQQQFDDRITQLNFYTSINQSLTQHYLKVENGVISTQPIHLQIHQLDKDNIKIEGIAYRNPNNKNEKQNIKFLAYSTTQNKDQITNNETDCKYTFHYSRAYLKISSKNKLCELFTGIYRIYD